MADFKNLSPEEKAALNRRNLESALPKIQEAQEAEQESLSIDFDAALKEHLAKTDKIRVKLFGQIIELPKQMPASVAVFINRNCIKTKNGRRVFEVESDLVLLDLAERILGPEIASMIEEDSTMPMDFFAEHVLSGIMEQWQIVKPGTNGQVAPSPTEALTHA